MTVTRRSIPQVVMLAFSIVGIAISIYLTIVHYDSNVPLVCSSKGFVNCENVLTSPFAVIPGTKLPITIPGMLWFAVMGALTLLAWRWRPSDRRLLLAELGWSALGMLTVFYLVYAELVRLHNLCAWCTVLHVIIFTMLIISAVLWQQSGSEDEEWEDEEEEVVEPQTPLKR